MKVIRTSEEFIFAINSNGERVWTYSTRSKLHLDTLTQAVGKNVMDLLELNVGKLIDIKTLEITEPK